MSEFKIEMPDGGVDKDFILNEIMTKILRSAVENMPDGRDKFCGQAMLLGEEISCLMMDIGGVCARCVLDETAAKELAVYLSAVKYGIENFIEQHSALKEAIDGENY